MKEKLKAWGERSGSWLARVWPTAVALTLADKGAWKMQTGQWGDVLLDFGASLILSIFLIAPVEILAGKASDNKTVLIAELVITAIIVFAIVR